MGDVIVTKRLANLILLFLTLFFAQWIDNLFDGEFPSSLLHSSLIDLDISYNNFSSFVDGIPTELLLLDNLEWLRADGVIQRPGPLPVEFATIPSLLGLSMRENYFTGTIPSEYGLMSSLWDLQLSGNSLTGSVPLELYSLPEIENLDLSFNMLSGPLEFTNSTLWVLDLSNNQFTGTIPTEVGLLYELDQLYLSNNQLSGTIPVELSYLYLLYSLDLSGNNDHPESAESAMPHPLHCINEASEQKNGMTFMQKEVECHCCHEVGHIATNCPKLAKKKEAKMNGFWAPLSERAEERIC